jgi:hypothetical protein
MGRAVALKLSDVPNNKRADYDDKSERRKSNPNRRCETLAQLHRKLHQEIQNNHLRREKNGPTMPCNMAHRLVRSADAAACDLGGIDLVHMPIGCLNASFRKTRLL